MKISIAAITSLLLALSHEGALAHTDEEGSTSPLRSRLRKARVANENASSSNNKPFLTSPAASRGKGRVQVQGKLGKIDVSNVAAAQAGARRILETLGVSSPNNKYVAKNSKAKHVRFIQQIHGMNVEGASIMVHSDAEGNVLAINGEILDDATIPSARPTIDSATAIAVALADSRVPAEFYDQCDAPRLTVVRGLSDGAAHLAWTCIVRYDVAGEDGYVTPYKDQIFAHADGDAGLIQIHPLIYGALSMTTRNCFQTETNCQTVSTSSTAINTGDAAINAAHNNAIDTYNYYLTKFGRDSVDNRGMTLTSHVHYKLRENNAFWDGSKMLYGDGDGSLFSPLSQDLDVVAHELTHGVTQFESNLIYQNESGALNEALSDIFAALVEKWKGQSDDPSNNHINDAVWKIGEDVWTPATSGDAMRYMYDPEKASSNKDYYPTRYVGTADAGGVHWNSGIANLAAYLMVAGGRHPRGKTTNIVTPLGGSTPYSPAAYDAVAKAFYFAQTECLTPGSTFEMMRFCMVDVYKPVLPGDSANIANAWAAVGVVKTPTSAPSLYTAPITNMALGTNGIQQYYMDIVAGQTVSCSTNGPNGDADLYLRLGSEAIPDPDFTGNACSSISEFSNESCSTGAASGSTRVYAAVHAYTAFSGLTLQCTKSTVSSSPTSAPPTSAPSLYTAPITNMALSDKVIRQYYMDVVAGQTVSCSTNGPNGDADLYLRFGSEAIPDPAFTGNACSSTSEFSVESCSTGAASGATRVYAAVHAYTAFSGLTLQCTKSTVSISPTSARPTSAPTSTSSETVKPTTRKPTTRKPTTRKPTTRKPTQAPTNEPTTESPTTDTPTTLSPTTESPTTESPTTESPTTASPTTASPTTESPTTESPTTAQPTSKPTSSKPTTRKPSTRKPTTRKPTTRKPTTSKPIM